MVFSVDFKSSVTAHIMFFELIIFIASRLTAITLLNPSAINTSRKLNTLIHNDLKSKAKAFIKRNSAIYITYTDRTTHIDYGILYAEYKPHLYIPSLDQRNWIHIKLINIWLILILIKFS